MVKAIIDNVAFVVNEEDVESFKVLNPESRICIAQSTKFESDFLMKMVDGEEYCDVCEAIWNNPNLDKNEENLLMLSNNGAFTNYIVDYDATTCNVLIGLLEIMGNSTEPGNYKSIITGKVWGHPNFIKSKENLERLLQIKDDRINSSLHNLIANDKESSTDILIRIFEDEILKEEPNDFLSNTIDSNLLCNIAKNLRNSDRKNVKFLESETNERILEIFINVIIACKKK